MGGRERGGMKSGRKGGGRVEEWRKRIALARLVTRTA